MRKRGAIAIVVLVTILGTVRGFSQAANSAVQQPMPIEQIAALPVAQTSPGASPIPTTASPVAQSSPGAIPLPLYSAFLYFVAVDGSGSVTFSVLVYDKSVVNSIIGLLAASTEQGGQNETASVIDFPHYGDESVALLEAPDAQALGRMLTVTERQGDLIFELEVYDFHPFPKAKIWAEYFPIGADLSWDPNNLDSLLDLVPSPSYEDTGYTINYHYTCCDSEGL